MKKKLLFGAFGALLLCGGIAAISINNVMGQMSTSCTATTSAGKFACTGPDNGCGFIIGDVVIECAGNKTIKIEEIGSGGAL